MGNTNKFQVNFVPTNELFGTSPELTESLTHFYLSKNDLGFQFDGFRTVKNLATLLPCFYCFLVLLIFPPCAFAERSKTFLPVPIANTQTNFSAEAPNYHNYDEPDSVSKMTSEGSLTQSGHQQKNYRILVASGIGLEFQDELKQVFQLPEVIKNFTALLSELSENGVALDQNRLDLLKKNIHTLKNLCQNSCRNQLQASMPAPVARQFGFPERDREIPDGFSGLCRLDNNDQVVGMVDLNTLIAFFQGSAVKGYTVRGQILAIQKSERLLNQLEDGVNLNELTTSLNEISSFLTNLEQTSNTTHQATKKPTTNFSVGTLQVYSSQIPIFKANLSAQINFASQNVFLGVGKAFFHPFYNTRLWEMKFGTIIGFDCSCGYNFSKNQYCGLRAKSFVGLGVKL